MDGCVGVGVLDPPVQMNPASQGGAVPFRVPEPLQYLPLGHGTHCDLLAMRPSLWNVPEGQGSGSEPLGQKCPAGHASFKNGNGKLT